MKWYKNFSLDNIVAEIDGILYIEEWKEIVDFPNYHVSNFGRIKSLSRFRGSGKGGYYTKERIKSQRQDSDGYLATDLYFNDFKTKKSSTVKVHRIVAATFFENYDNKPTVNHIVADKTNNFFKNLEWSTHLEQKQTCF